MKTAKERIEELRPKDLHYRKECDETKENILLLFVIGSNGSRSIEENE